MEKVLLVDDEEVIRDVCRQILEAEGYDTTTAASGREALNLINRNRYDLVVTDIMMPEMSGLELLETIRNTHLEVSAIVITGLGTYEMATRSDRLGAREFVVKPFTPQELTQAVRKSLAQHRLPAA